MTKNMVVGESVYGEKRISVEVRFKFTVVTVYVDVYVHSRNQVTVG